MTYTVLYPATVYATCVHLDTFAPVTRSRFAGDATRPSSSPVQYLRATTRHHVTTSARMLPARDGSLDSVLYAWRRRRRCEVGPCDGVISTEALSGERLAGGLLSQRRRATGDGVSRRHDVRVAPRRPRCQLHSQHCPPRRRLRRLQHTQLTVCLSACLSLSLRLNRVTQPTTATR